MVVVVILLGNLVHLGRRKGGEDWLASHDWSRYMFHDLENKRHHTCLVRRCNAG